MDTVTLASGASLPRLIKGGWQLAGGHGPVDRAAAIRDMFAFAEAGVTAFDCADIYTGVEELIGDFLRQWRTTYPSIPIRIHTKCVPDLKALLGLTPADVHRIVHRSRQRLGVETIDLVQLHWWDYDIEGAVQAAGALLRLREQGVLHWADQLRQYTRGGLGCSWNSCGHTPGAVLTARPTAGSCNDCPRLHPRVHHALLRRAGRWLLVRTLAWRT